MVRRPANQQHDPGALLRLLRMLERASDFSLGFVQADAAETRMAAEAHLTTELNGVCWVSLVLPPDSETLDGLLADALGGVSGKRRVVLSMTGFEDSFRRGDDQLGLLGWLNTNRDQLKHRYPHTWLIWATREAMNWIQHEAPDFCSWSRGIYCLSEQETVQRAAFLKRYDGLVAGYLGSRHGAVEVVGEASSEFLAHSFTAREAYKGEVAPAVWVLGSVEVQAARAGGGSVGADFLWLYREWFQTIHRLFSEWGFPPDEVGELVQRTLFRLFNNWQEVEKGTSPGESQMLDMATRVREGWLAEMELPDKAVDGDGFEAGRALEWFRKMTKQLNPLARQIMELRGLGTYSFVEIAYILGLSVEVVGIQYRQALKEAALVEGEDNQSRRGR